MYYFISHKCYRWFDKLRDIFLFVEDAVNLSNDLLVISLHLERDRNAILILYV